MAVTWRKLVYVNDAIGTPTSGTLTNCTGLPVGGVSATGTPDATTFLRGDGVWVAAGGSSVINNVISTPTTIAADTSYVVVDYLDVQDDFTVAGNVAVI